MKIAFTGLIIIIAVTGYWLLSDKPDIYGTQIEQTPEVSVEEIINNTDQYLDQTITVSGRINRQCPGAGCWFFIESSAGPLKVEMGHLGIRFPQSIGKTARVQGQILKTENTLELIGESVVFE